MGSRVVGEEGWRLRKAAGLVKLLALASHHRLHREQLMEALWPDLVPRSAANNLHQTLHAARRTLEPEARDFRYLILRDELLLLCPDGALRVDVDVFEEAAAEARRSGEPAAYRRALELYTGDLLPRDRYEDWAEERRTGLRQEYLALLSGLSAIYEGRGDFDRAIEALQSVLGAGDVVPVRLSWSATDTEGEVTGYQLQQSTDGGPYENVGLADATTTTRTLGLAPGSDHRLRVRATDDNGNRSDWRYGTRFALDTLQENDPSISYAKTWKFQSLADAYGGKLGYTTARGAKATFSFSGTDVAWVAPKSKARGKAAVYLDGAKVATVDLFSRQTLARQVVFSKGDLDPATPHTLEVRSLGTSGRPRVDVDAFAVLR